MLLDVYFRFRKLLLVAGKLRSKCESFDSPVSGNDVLLVLLLRLPLADAVDVVDVADLDLAGTAFFLVVLVGVEDTREFAGVNLFAIFLLALRLAFGDCVSECS